MLQPVAQTGARGRRQPRRLALTLPRPWQRLYGWLGCFGIGSLLSIVSWFLIGSPIAFGVVYTFGNLISLFSSMFLCGPKRQFQNMTDKTRIGTTAVFLLFMGLTLFCAFKKPPSKIGVIICGFIQVRQAGSGRAS